MSQQLYPMSLAYLTWNPDPEIINIGGFSLRYYGLLFIGGLVLCLYILKWMYKRENLPQKNVERLSVYGLISILIGARLGHCLFYEPGYYLEHPLEMILPVKFPAEGGMKLVGYHGLASHGGALGLFIGLFLYSRKTKHALIDTIDLIAVVAGLGSAFIRLANFMNSEILGMPTDKPWGVIFERVDDLPRHPAQLYEAFSYLLIFGVMMFLYIKKREHLRNGFFFGLLLTLLFSARILIEFVKENQVGFEEGMLLNMGQWLSLPYILIGVAFMIYGLRKTQSARNTLQKS